MTQVNPIASSDKLSNQSAHVNGKELEKAIPTSGQDSTAANNEPDTSSDTWIGADPNDPVYKGCRVAKQPFMAANIVGVSNSLQFKKVAVKQLGITTGGKMAVAYNAETDFLGLRPNPANGRGITTGMKTMSVNRWLRSDFGFELPKRETYRIEENEPGADPPYIIPLSGRKTQY